MLLILAFVALLAGDKPYVSHSILKIDVDALSKTYKGRIPFSCLPQQIILSPKRPPDIVYEPTYSGVPRYGVLIAGNGPRSRVVIAVDDKKLYVDSNGDGDLAEDKPTPLPQDGTMAVRTVSASYGNSTKETGASPYSFGFFRDQKNNIWYAGQSGRVGQVQIGGKKHKALLVCGAPDAVFAQPEPRKLHPGYSVDLFVDMYDRGDVGFQSVMVDIRAPFVIGRRKYSAAVSPDGANLTIQDIGERPVTPYVPPLALLKPGQHVPNFSATRPGGGRVSLSSLNGRVVVLCWWATWSEPCMSWLPHLDTVWQRLKSRGDSTVLAICTLDKLKSFDKWVSNNKASVSLPLAFLSSGKSGIDEIARGRFGVTGIPTTVVMDKDGFIVDVIYGYEQEKELHLDAALKLAGVDLDAPQ